MRLRTLPGEQAQVDWGHFGRITIGKAVRLLSAFVMVLSFSRKLFLRFYLSQNIYSFLDAHVRAFEYFGGAVHVVLYDNPKIVVLERHGDIIRFHPTLLAFAGHYRYEPRPVAIRRGNEKGRVERAIRYIRTAFFAARHFTDLDDLNEQAASWMSTQADARRWPDDHSITVSQAFDEEKSRLLALPETSFPIEERCEVHVGKTPYIRFDLNDYSVPHTYVRKTLTVRATQTCVRILDGLKVLVSHPRSFDKHRQIEAPEHIEQLLNVKRLARSHRGLNYLADCVPCVKELLGKMAKRNLPLGAAVAALLRLLNSYGQAELELAVREALNRGACHPHAVRQILEKRRDEKNAIPPVPVDLPDNANLRTITVRPHCLEDYDNLQNKKENDHGKR